MTENVQSLDISLPFLECYPLKKHIFAAIKEGLGVALINARETKLTKPFKTH